MRRSAMAAHGPAIGFGLADTGADALVEPPYTVRHHGDRVPRRQIFSAVNLQFALN